MRDREIALPLFYQTSPIFSEPVRLLVCVRHLFTLERAHFPSHDTMPGQNVVTLCDVLPPPLHEHTGFLGVSFFTYVTCLEKSSDNTPLVLR